MFQLVSTSIGRALAGLAFLLAGAGVAQAASIAVNPVRLTLSARQTVGAVTVRNDGREPAVVQLEASSWTQRDGADVLTPSNEILANPPILTIPPGSSKIVRVGLRRAPPSDGELTYRLILQEVPPPKSDAQELRVALRISMPIFVNPARAPAPDLKWRAVRTEDGRVRLHARNEGNAHVQLGTVTVALATSVDDEGGEEIAARSMSEYVLPRNGKSWTVAPKTALATGTPLRISSQTDAGRMQFDVVLEDEAPEATAFAAGGAPR